jgi:hypothetical protein
MTSPHPEQPVETAVHEPDFDRWLASHRDDDGEHYGCAALYECNVRRLAARASVALDGGLDVERLAETLDGWFVVGDEKWRLVPMSEDGGLSVTSPMSLFAEMIAARLTDPSR